MKKTALVEISGGHSECLYSQLQFLKDAGHEVTLVLSDNLLQQVEDFDRMDKVVTFERKGGWKNIFKVWKYLRAENFDYIILNTAQGNIIQKLMLLPFGKGTHILGTLHNIKKLKKGLSQKIISRRVNHYFVLNDYLLEQVPAKLREKKSFSSYYSIFFPQFKPVEISKGESEKWVVIPGQVERKRRDYDRLFNELKQHPMPQNIKFILLGKSRHKEGDGEWVQAQIESLGLSQQFVSFDLFVSNELFHHYLKQADLILPLIHPDGQGFEMYLRGQISGAFNMAFAYQKPMLIEESFREFSDFRDTSYFYRAPELIEKMLAAVSEAPGGMYLGEKWGYEFQRDGFLKQL